MATKGIPVDEQFLKDFLAKGGKAETPTGTPVSQQQVDEIAAAASKVQTATPADEKKSQLRNRVNARKHQAEAQAEDEQAAEIRRRKEQQRQEDEDETRRNAQAQTAFKVAQKTVDTALQPAKRLADRVSTVRTVGGIGALLLILMILLFAIVPANAQGDTRLKQLWYMLNGRSSLQGRQALQKPDPNASKALAQQELQTLGSVGNQFTVDLSSVVSSAANSAVNSATGGVVSFFEALGTDLENSYRNLP